MKKGFSKKEWRRILLFVRRGCKLISSRPFIKGDPYLKIFSSVSTVSPSFFFMVPYKKSLIISDYNDSTIFCAHFHSRLKVHGKRKHSRQNRMVRCWWGAYFLSYNKKKIPQSYENSSTCFYNMRAMRRKHLFEIT